MSIGDKIDWHEFNCSEQHELDYVKNLYAETDDVELFLKASCIDNTINKSTHTEVYALLKEAGFTKIK